ncbi:hypothetical protein MJG53_013030 [Ovis ammon polii x Ovis aries]|uniref:Uncharacterized protein n=1 Tax=Ovis ammon polii x Ovis aries TaxID=2918886 RepID=A0ACB9UM73_9CETA|nr:hypothetical protein MJG53_013030 [Ovis ammon polii x Ovis aries]
MDQTVLGVMSEGPGTQPSRVRSTHVGPELRPTSCPQHRHDENPQKSPPTQVWKPRPPATLHPKDASPKGYSKTPRPAAGGPLIPSWEREQPCDRLCNTLGSVTGAEYGGQRWGGSSVAVPTLRAGAGSRVERRKPAALVNLEGLYLSDPGERWAPGRVTSISGDTKKFLVTEAAAKRYSEFCFV